MQSATVGWRLGPGAKYFSPVQAALLYRELGNDEKTFEWLEKAYERRQLTVPWIRVNPSLDPLRSDPRYADLLRRIGFPES